MKKFLALLAALCLLMPAAVAEESILPAVQPLVDVTATAVMLTGEQIQPDQTMSDTLVQAILQAGLKQGLYTAFDMNNIAWRDSYLTAAYAVPCGLTDQVAELANYAFMGVRPMAIDESDDGRAVRILGDIYQADGPLDTLTTEQYARVQWLDRRAVVELRAYPEYPEVPTGWRIASFVLDAEWEMEDAAQSYFAETMAEYVNAEWGFSIQYPAVFGEEAITMEENGIAGALDGASFRVERLENTQGWTTETLLAHYKQETPGAEANMNDITGLGKVTAVAEKQVQVRMLVVTDAYIYQAQLSYDESLSKDFSLYSDYMINSFTVDELGLG